MFNDDQKQLLAAPLNRANVKTREQGNKTLSYIEGYFAIEEANRIFGFDGWTRETIFATCVNDGERTLGREPNTYPGWGVTYLAKVKITVGGVVREGCGAGHGMDRDRGLAHESAVKEAETDAMKRALMTFGNQFGLALYDKTQANVESGPSRQDQQLTTKRLLYIESCHTTIEEFKTKQALLTWWNSDAQKKVRRDYQLSDGDVELLKARVIAKAEQLDGKG